ncbi:Arginine N-methyltransferase 2 [Metarhizium album ARSEF 1941]|uniref:Arginine N-methyltransferase 2 n=1 Tax=Metarhizium album (strain ARSEF 1941) TaxID=1081103 RepID=A0A0B2WV98_METAS|nr:Arginine N-methyltransferase 2 [Metarhizium album ARSEF 1941]KHO00037.1 Arginine N-methyltransferase 2 [Metarhizium album ARSEF 1941]
MSPPIDDSMPTRISSDCPQDTRDVLYHAWAHDLSDLKKLLDVPGKASAQDPQTGETPLHAAIRACGPADPDSNDPEQGEDGCVEEASAVLQELFFSGAIWNDVDSNDETPGCVAHRLGRKALYDMCVDAGVRAELLFSLMDGYEKLSSASDAEVNVDDDDDEGAAPVEQDGDAIDTTGDQARPQDPPRFIPPGAGEKPVTVTSDGYLSSQITYDSSKLLDADLNGVMMSWETDIMARSVAALLPGPQVQTGKRILNIGFGMGIVDGMFAQTNPSRHHIIEAHPSVLRHLSQPDSGFGKDWERRGPDEGAYKVWPGRWQDIVPQLLDQGEVYDAIYFDTFGEDYSQLRLFFMEYVPGLMDREGRFSFFNGLGADRQVCYDVYTKVVEMHGADAGLDVEWEVSDVDMKGLKEDGKGQWEGVRRRYWTLDKYRLPVCTFMG